VLVNSPATLCCSFKLVDAKFHSDSSHRCPNLVVPAASHAMCGAFLMEASSFVEPIYHVDISGHDIMNGTYDVVIGHPSGMVVESSKNNIKAFVPVHRAKGIARPMPLALQCKNRHIIQPSIGMQLVPLTQVATVIEEARSCNKLNEWWLLTASDFVDEVLK
jgi:hypothetical protein